MLLFWRWGDFPGLFEQDRWNHKGPYEWKRAARRSESENKLWWVKKRGKSGSAGEQPWAKGSGSCRSKKRQGTDRFSPRAGVSNPWDLMLDDERWSWCNNNNTNKCTINAGCLYHPETISLPSNPFHGTIVFHETGLWCQKCWGPWP